MNIGLTFLGDIAIPSGAVPRVSALPPSSLNSLVVANLEGPIVPASPRLLQQRILFNDLSAIEFLLSHNIGVVSLANNHILDLDRSKGHALTKELLRSAGIEACGAGSNLEDASRSLVCTVGARTVIFLAFGWKPIGCVPATRTRAGVNPLRPAHVLRSVIETRRRYPDALVVLLMHWCYELEWLPHPMHRQLAMRSVDEGADAVVGCHSHCVQGIEMYQGSPIVYGLGNWFLPSGVYFGGTLSYPAFSYLQLAFEWRPEAQENWCHWYRYEPAEHRVAHVSSEVVSRSRRLADLTPYADLSHEEYVAFFLQNRRKRRLLPAYRSCDAPLANRMRDAWIAQRARAISLLDAVKLKGPLR